MWIVVALTCFVCLLERFVSSIMPLVKRLGYMSNSGDRSASGVHRSVGRLFCMVFGSSLECLRSFVGIVCRKNSVMSLRR